MTQQSEPLTPLDVVKTRLQTQHDLGHAGYAEAPTESATSQRAAAHEVHACPAQQQRSPLSLWSSSRAPAAYRVSTFPVTLAANGQAACVYPGKCTPHVCEVETLLHEQRMHGILDGIVKVLRAEGWRGLWRGLVPTVAMTVPSQVTYMTCYDAFRRLLLSLDSPPITVVPSMFDENEMCVPEIPGGMPYDLDEVPTSTFRVPVLGASLVSGALSRSVSATLVTPLELLRTRLQASHGRSSFASVLEPLYREVQANGISVLWRGLSATLWRDVPFSAIYFTGYEGGKYLFTGAGFGESHTSTFWQEFGISFGVGATSGSVAAFLTHPFDLVKTRLQAETQSRNHRYPPGAARPSSAMLGTLRCIVASEGIAGAFRGLTPRLAKVAPSCGIMIGSFEVVGRWLAHRHPQT
ncbi:MTM1 [Malassezia furfur]|nr:MTM1 [Malassezia furfur]